jgi:hypothetical protein
MCAKGLGATKCPCGLFSLKPGEVQLALADVVYKDPQFRWTDVRGNESLSANST